jgi:hypothetical protein
MVIADSDRVKSDRLLYKLRGEPSFRGTLASPSPQQTLRATKWTQV